MALPTPKKRWLTTSAATFVMAALIHAPVANAVVPNDNFEGEAAIDNEGGVNGVGMFLTSTFGACTGTLINPRTVLFAAHCVNDRPETDYGTLVSSAFSFNVNALPGFQNWFQSGFVTNTDLNVFNVSQIQYHPDSLLNPQARGFLEADIALATLDTPASEIPTWALLFSALPAPDQLDPVLGTGYHVNITGYGASGNGTLGDFQPIDFRRRAAENMLGAFASIDDRDAALFGPDAPFLPQNVYFTDFDDPAGTGPLDINIFLDEPLEREGTTAGGDSGGPLILDAANNGITDIDIQIGVLSGGGGFLGNNFSAYGEFSIYQPLHLFADYIAAANPYRYVSTVGGDGNWEDESHWQTDIDPNYYVFNETGALVNGFPDEQPAGINGTDGDFGAVCVDFPPRDVPRTSNCLDLSTGQLIPDPVDDDGGNDGTTPALGFQNAVGRVDANLLLGTDTIGSGDNSVTLTSDTGSSQTVEATGSLNVGNGLSGADVRNALGSVDLELILGNDGVSPSNSTVTLTGPVAEDGEEVSEDGEDPNALPDPTIENGLPGATNFVPNNIDPDVATNTRGRYFDVTLSAEGTTTLSSVVEIDRLTLAGGNLTIAESGSLTSLIDVQQMGGINTVNGTLNSVGDYLLMTGLLTGNGTVQTPFLTSVAGMIAPGSMTDIGTLTIDGSAVLSSGSTLLINLGANGVSDRLVVTGDSSLGGTVLFGASADVRNGNQYTFLTTGGTQTGGFNTAPISALLTPEISVGENSVSVSIVAGSFQEALTPSTATSAAYASLLDQARNTSSFNPIFDILDLASVDDIDTILNSWEPAAETTAGALTRATSDHLSIIHQDRMDNFGSRNWGGKVTMVGQPILLASNASNLDAVSSETLMAAAEGDNVQLNTSIPDDFEIFLSAAFLDGESEGLSVNGSATEDTFDGWSVMGGIEHRVSDNASIGASVSYMTIDSDGALGRTAENEYFAGSLYGQLRSGKGLKLDGLLSLGSYGIETERNVALPSGAVNQLVSDDDSLAFVGELKLSKDYVKKDFIVTPRASLRNTVINFDNVVEEGGILALNIDRDKFISTQGRLGLQLGTKADSAIQVRVSGDWVNELANSSDTFTAGFAAVPNSSALFPTISSDSDWFEVGGAVGVDAGPTRIELAATTTLDRSDVEAQSYRARVSYKF